MLILIAENGQSFDLDCRANTTVESVQNCLESLTGISVANQMLICGESRLDPLKALGHYNLPDDRRRVVLYNRSRLPLDSPPPPEEEPENIDPVLPSSPSSVNSTHPLDEASDPALKILPSYERQFKYHLQKAHAIYGASQARFDSCRRLLREIQVQQLALETGQANMEFYNKAINQQYTDFTKQYSRHYREHTDLLANLDRDMARLRACKLHPALRSQVRVTLLDCMKEASVRKWAEECSSSHRQLNAKVLELKSSFAELQRNVQDLFRVPPAVDVQALEDRIEDYVPFSVEQSSIIQTLSKDVNTVKKIVEERVSSQYSSQRTQDGGSMRPHDAVSAFGPMYDIHDTRLLPRLDHLDCEFAKLLDLCRKSKNAMSICVHTRMQSVAALQSSIRDLRLQLLGYKEAMAHEAEMFQELKLVRKVGSAYKACLAEVVRRKACMKLYMGQAGQVAEKLARRREAEVARREAFLRVQSQYLPQEVIQGMGLFENPSQCVVNIAPFDTHLLDLDIADLDRFAPEHLKGLHSSESNVLGTGDDHQGDTRDENEVDDDSDEIAGTSRLEVENAWLKSELAAAVAILCNLDPDIEIHDAREIDESQAKGENPAGSSRLATQKTSEALKLKDEHAKVLETIIATQKSQCASYEKRIRELEQRLDDQHMQKQRLSGNVSQQVLSMIGGDEGSDSETSGITGIGKIGAVPEPMDEGVSSAAGFDQRQRIANTFEHSCTANEHNARTWEAGDETMCDVSGVGSAVDAPMVEARKETVNRSENDASEKSTEAVALESVKDKDSVVPEKHATGAESDPVPPACACDDKVSLVVEDVTAVLRERTTFLQQALVDKTRECELLEERLNSFSKEVEALHAERESKEQLFTDCQMNCAHLENRLHEVQSRLHEAREESRTNLCAADRRAAEYTALRTSSVRLRGLMERLRNCISAPVGGANGFAESLRALAISLASISDAGEDGMEFRASIRVLADRVGALAQQRAELLDRCNAADAARGHLAKELEEKSELLKNFYAKRKAEKQASKEKICFTRFNVHELAVFMPNDSGHYEAINVNCPHYYLSDESIALFPDAQKYIVGQIVHIDRNVARQPPDIGTPLSSTGSELSGNAAIAGGGLKLRSNPYGLPVGTEYFVVTVAMVPDFLSF